MFSQFVASYAKKHLVAAAVIIGYAARALEPRLVLITTYIAHD